MCTGKQRLIPRYTPIEKIKETKLSKTQQNV